MIDQIFGIGAVSYKLFQLSHETIGHSEVQRPEICEERLINQVLKGNFKGTLKKKRPDRCRRNRR